MKNLQTLLSIIEEQEKNYDFNDIIDNYIDETELQEAIENETIQDYLESINENYELTDTEVIYYHKAIEYIKENDPSMQECFEIASEYGYET
jgi:hypothetical protein